MDHSDSFLCFDSSSFPPPQVELDSSHISTPQRRHAQRPTNCGFNTTQLVSLLCGIALGRFLPLSNLTTCIVALTGIGLWHASQVEWSSPDVDDDGISLLHIVNQRLTPQRPMLSRPLRTVDEHYSYRPYGSPWKHKSHD